MGLEKHLKEVDGLSDNEKQAMIERSVELQSDGMSEKDADLAVLGEMREDIENDHRALKDQLGLSAETKEEAVSRRGQDNNAEISSVTATYRKNLMGIDSGKRKNSNPKKD